MNKAIQQVILLHGLGRTRFSMNKLAQHLTAKNLQVFNLGYNGLFDSYQTILTHLDRNIEKLIDPQYPVHFVGHSLGGILIRGLLAQRPEWHTGRCVMLGTPNQGTQTARFMLSHWLLRFLSPKITHDLVPDSLLLKTLPEPSIETGIIAGNISYNFFIPVSWYYKRATNNAPGDGVVELYNTQCSTMTDFIQMPLHHSFMTWDSQLIAQVYHFISQGHFAKEQQSSTNSPVQL